MQEAKTREIQANNSKTNNKKQSKENDDDDQKMNSEVKTKPKLFKTVVHLVTKLNYFLQVDS